MGAEAMQSQPAWADVVRGKRARSSPSKPAACAGSSSVSMCNASMSVCNASSLKRPVSRVAPPSCDAKRVAVGGGTDWGAAQLSASDSWPYRQAAWQMVGCSVAQCATLLL